MSQKQISSTLSPAPKTWVRELFKRMLSMWGNTYLDKWAGADTEQREELWAIELGKLSADELKRGYAGLLTLKWPPDLPTFIQLCRPGADPANAYAEAVAGAQARERGEVGVWSHPAIYWASVAVGAFDLKHKSAAEMRGRWAVAMEREMAKGEWPAVPVPHLALPAPGKSETSAECAAQMVKIVGGIVRKSAAADGLRWAHRIMERHAAGEPVTTAQLRDARIALRVQP
jgi:hypothetical protein